MPFIQRAAFDLFRISKDTLDAQREELASLRATNAGLTTQLAAALANFEWTRMRLNAVEVERAMLLDKVYHIQPPVPEIVRLPAASMDLGSDIFEDVGDDNAKLLGYPTWPLSKSNLTS